MPDLSEYQYPFEVRHRTNARKGYGEWEMVDPKPPVHRQSHVPYDLDGDMRGYAFHRSIGSQYQSVMLDRMFGENREFDRSNDAALVIGGGLHALPIAMSLGGYGSIITAEPNLTAFHTSITETIPGSFKDRQSTIYPQLIDGVSLIQGLHTAGYRHHFTHIIVDIFDDRGTTLAHLPLQTLVDGALSILNPDGGTIMVNTLRPVHDDDERSGHALTVALMNRLRDVGREGFDGLFTTGDWNFGEMEKIEGPIRSKYQVDVNSVLVMTSTMQP